MYVENPGLNSMLDPFQNLLKFQIGNKRINHYFTEEQVSLPASDLTCIFTITS